MCKRLPLQYPAKRRGLLNGKNDGMLPLRNYYFFKEFTDQDALFGTILEMET